MPGIEIRVSATVVVQLFYVKPLSFSPGQPIKVGDPVAIAMNIVPPYAPGTTHHVHLEIEDHSIAKKHFIDPATLIPQSNPQPQPNQLPQPNPPVPRRKPPP